MDVKKLNKELGNADLILIDQILKERFNHQMKILDAGCGEGRNMVYFVRNNYNIFGIDPNEKAIRMARILCHSINKQYILENIQCISIEENLFPDQYFDAIICINVLHSVADRNEFFNIMDKLLKLLNKGGYMILSMESRIGLFHERVTAEVSMNSVCGQMQTFYFSEELKSELLTNDQLIEIEPAKTILIDDIKSYTYLFLQKKA